LMYSPLWIKCVDLSKDNGSVVGHALAGPYFVGW